MNLDDFNKLCANRGRDESRTRAPVTVGDHPHYSDYRDIRGIAAREIGSLMGVEEESGIAHTGHLVELRTARDHLRLSAHAPTYSTETRIYGDGSIITVEIDRLNKKALQTVYSNNGTIEKLAAPWAAELNGYQGPYARVSLEEGKSDEVAAIWSKYESALMKAEILTSGPHRFPNKPPSRPGSEMDR